MAALTKKQKSLMSRHGEHHSPKHMKEMTKAILAGSTFTAAHKKAMKKVGV